MPLLNTDDALQEAKRALMDNLSRGCQTSRQSGYPNDEGEETTIFTTGDVCMELSSKGGLFVRPINGDGGDYLGAGFGGRKHWQMAQENGKYVLLMFCMLMESLRRGFKNNCKADFHELIVMTANYFKFAPPVTTIHLKKKRLCLSL